MNAAICPAGAPDEEFAIVALSTSGAAFLAHLSEPETDENSRWIEEWPSDFVAALQASEDAHRVFLDMVRDPRSADLPSLERAIAAIRVAEGRLAQTFVVWGCKLIQRDPNVLDPGTPEVPRFAAVACRLSAFYAGFTALPDAGGEKLAHINGANAPGPALAALYRLPVHLTEAGFSVCQGESNSPACLRELAAGFKDWIEYSAAWRLSFVSRHLGAPQRP